MSVDFQTTWYDPHGNQVSANSAHAVRQVTEPTFIVNGNFDTVIHRGTTVNIAGVNTEASVSISVDWLSLKSVNAIYVPDGPIPGLAGGWYDLYVGVNSDPHSTPDTGWFRLRSNTEDGSQGHINMGAMGDAVDTTLQFTDPSSDLGLPLNWKTYFVPAGGTPSTSFPFVTGFFNFHNQTWIPDYILVPEPSSTAVLGLGALVLVIKARGGRKPLA